MLHCSQTTTFAIIFRLLKTIHIFLIFGLRPNATAPYHQSQRIKSSCSSARSKICSVTNTHYTLPHSHMHTFIIIIIIHFRNTSHASSADEPNQSRKNNIKPFSYKLFFAVPLPFLSFTALSDSVLVSRAVQEERTFFVFLRNTIIADVHDKE